MTRLDSTSLRHNLLALLPCDDAGQQCPQPQE